MDDLKRRLRERADAAAAEGTATATGDALHFREAADAIEALQAEAARLREVLRKIADADRLPTPSYGGVPGQYDYLPRSGRFGMMARAALGDDND